MALNTFPVGSGFENKKPGRIPIPVKISHLGITFGNEDRGRIIALPTSEVFGDSSLIPSLLQVSPASLDNGFQAHMYTCSSDTLVVSLPDLNETLIQHTKECIAANSEIWQTLTGINLVNENVVIASNQESAAASNGLQIMRGSLLEVAVNAATDTGKALVAFVLNENFLQKYPMHCTADYLIRVYAQTTGLLMDKNKTMQLLKKNHVAAPVTYFSGKNEKSIDKALKYVYKPSGGAAGLGVYLNEGRGAGWDEIQNHIKILENEHLLPGKYQIQEYIPGPVYGALVLFHPDKKPEILQIHEQIINNKNKYIAGYWTPENQDKKFSIVEKLVQQIAAIKELQYIGLMGIDLIDGKIIEINPRITASSPVSHLLSKEKTIKDYLGSDFKINRIDINTGISIPPELIRNGQLIKIIVGLWSVHRVLILPQGLNPDGNSRVLFVNDNHQNQVQEKFLAHCSRNQ
jgi:hypothetical protein